MGRLKWFDRFLTNEIVAQNRFLTRRRRKNRFLRPIKEITSSMGLSPVESPLYFHVQYIRRSQHVHYALCALGDVQCALRTYNHLLLNISLSTG